MHGMFEQEQISKQELTEETESFFPSPFSPFAPVEIAWCLFQFGWMRFETTIVW
jgi:hypothetical protein